MKCQVRWINKETGKLTPDENDAVMMAHFHKPIWGVPGPDNKIQGYSEEIQESFPICAEHYAMVDDSFRLPRGGWTFEPLPAELPVTEEPQPHVVVPEWMNAAQVETISELYKRNPDGARNQAEFFHRVQKYRDYIGLSWCGMFVGIEEDGESHT